LKDLATLGESVDRLITVDVAGRGVVHSLYNQVKKLALGSLTLKAAHELFTTIRKGDTVIITTGFLIPPTMIPETDGPIGAMILSKVLSLAFGVKSVIIAEEEVFKLIIALAKILNLNAEKIKASSNLGELNLFSFPLEDGAAKDYSKKTIEEFNPSAIIAVEKVGRNRFGVYHNMHGIDVSERTIKVDYLFQEAVRKRILTLGVGDGGNEIGMGVIEETVKKHVNFGEICNCPCKSGISCMTKTDQLIISSVSNWGVYGIVACLSGILEKKELLHSGKIEKALLTEAKYRGAVDGVTGKIASSVDGLSSNIHFHVVELLRETVLHSIFS